MPRLPWPLPAVLAWALAWVLFRALLGAGLAPVPALLSASAAGALASVLGSTRWRRALIALGFPLALLLSQTAHWPAWAWLLPLALLAMVYPLNAWRDAPLFPTPVAALNGLAAAAPLSAGARVLDAGCGLGHGLQALRWTYPQVQLHGVEWSWPLRLVCALRCPWARVRQGDMWRADWRPYALVYLFQRPESMARAVAKAEAELAPGAWLVSLEFEATALRPTARLQGADGRPVWLYQMPFHKA
ncbi:hypothetical protein GCM10007320_25240 [Pseudorhodoferax aquiterrae]|uniref:Methyltransferase type 12 n=1 Tax=Pseudorhodoferax aquiterrae TaxID=747304 RepID=A0ABQ3G139_9BURK|nr:class I SAM-dependent methyltransferase [Pseudorhodoferax aquiterrae]GHC82239.1 hypothetical protein GCM10007320_25240 [Pseudorhodoferax aquiterrae]